MQITKSTPVAAFQPYDLTIRIEHELDESLLRGLMRKLRARVFPDGKYMQIIDQILNAFGD